MTPPRYGRAARKAQPAVKQRPQQNKFEAPHLVVDGKRGQTAEVSYPMSDAYDAEAAPYLDPLADIPYAPQTERSRSESAPMVHAQPNRLTAKRVLDVVGAFGLAIGIRDHGAEFEAFEGLAAHADPPMSVNDRSATGHQQ